VDGTLVEQTRMRAGIARRMVESKQQAPHFYVQTEVSVGSLKLRLAALNESGAERVTMTVALVRACVAALKEHPRLNAVWTPDGLFQATDVNVGVAIALDDGLVAPALLAADQLDVLETQAALRDLVDRARSQRLRPAELSEATFTLSNLGMFDVSAFTAIVTPPQVAILATARPVERWVGSGEAPERASLLTATLSADHRAVDGVDAARFLQTFKQAMEDPETLLVERSEPKEAMS
jgi:pyruvate dehydrogenase E2 component (dihydrolipoyllysine-residue acetyltransferase)